MSTRLQLPTVDCDGCGLAVLECMGDGVEAALQECGWVSRERNGSRQVHLCPVCRPDSPFEAVKRVRRRAEGPTPAVQGDWMAGYASAMRDVLRALEGDSDEPAGP